MRKVLLLVLILLSIFLGYSFTKEPFDPFDKLRVFDSLRSLRVNQSSDKSKEIILKIGLVADSHTENDLLAKALLLAKSANVDFVIGLGDYTNLGTVDELTAARRVFDQSGLTYYVIPGDRDGWESRERGEANTTNFNLVFGCHSEFKARSPKDEDRMVLYSSESNNQILKPVQDDNKNRCSASQVFGEKGMQFVILDNSDIYKGVGDAGWRLLEETERQRAKGDKDSNYSVSSGSSVTLPLLFVFAHKTPFHPDSAHVMGEDSQEVSRQARKLVGLIEDKKVDGFFSGDIHFFARFNSPNGSVKITTIGAVASQKNFQGPRFAILKVYDDYSWEVEDVEIR